MGIRSFSSAAPSTAVGSSNIIDFPLADIGEGIAEVEVLEWHVKEGSAVRQFDNVCTVQSDKASVDITSRYDGTVTKVHHLKGEMVAVGATLISIEAEAAAPDKAAAPTAATQIEAAAPPAAAIQLATQVATQAEWRRNLATPAVRKMVKERGLDLSTINGTGPHGRVLKSDVQVAGTCEGSGSRVLKADIMGHEQEEEAPPSSVPLRGQGKAMFRTMTASLAIPHFVYSDEYDMGGLKSAQLLLGTSALPIVLKAVSVALRDFPLVNASIKEEGVVFNEEHNIGVAMDTPHGLVVPVVRDVAGRSVAEIAEEIGRLRELAQAGKLTPDDFNATLTVSNIGSIGGSYMAPVVAAPQVAICAIGRTRRTPVFKSADSDEVVAAHLAPVSWAADHRVLDGATVARFSNRVKELLAEPLRFLAELR